MEFVFCPSLPGIYQEKIVVENLQDHTNDQIVNVKANIRKPSNFFIKYLSLNFGSILIDDVIPIRQQVTIDNTSKKQRNIEIAYDPKLLKRDEFMVDITMDVSNEKGQSGLSKEDDEQVEHLEQKLKIAKRKGQDAKIQKIMDKLVSLQSAPVSQDVEDNTAEEPPQSPTLFKLKKTMHSLIVSMSPCSSVVINVEMKIVTMSKKIQESNEMETLNSVLYVHEHKNMDYMKKIEFTAQLYFNAESFKNRQTQPIAPISRTNSFTSEAFSEGKFP